MQNWKATRSMHNLLLMFTVLVASWLGTTPLYALTPTPTMTATPTATQTATATTVFVNSKDNFQGDRVVFSQRVPITVVDDGGGTRALTLQPGTELRGIGQSTPTKVDFVVIHCSAILGLFGHSEAVTADGKGCEVATDREQKIVALPNGSVVQIDSQYLQSNPPNRYGLAFGGLVVPFKFQLTGAHQLSASATVGPYMGYKFAAQTVGFAGTAALFAGASNIAVTKAGSTSTQQLAGFSAGGGLLFEIKGGFQAGAVCGIDSVGSGQGFEYNNKPWLALQLGYSFSQ